MSIPATPRRNILVTRAQGIHTQGPSIFPFHIDKSPSLRAASSHRPPNHGNQSRLPNQTLTRSSFAHKPSHPPVKTPNNNSIILDIADATATAPARVPVPKRSREVDDDDYDEREMVFPSRPSRRVPRTEEPPVTVTTVPTVVAAQKRPRSVQPPSQDRLSKKAKLEERAEERIRQEERFKDKYTRAFPGFKFYFDSLEPAVKTSFTHRVLQLGARVEDFFSATVTHFITNKPVPTPEDLAVLENKENAPSSTLLTPRPSAPRGQANPAPPPLRSPIKLRPPTAKYDPLVAKAVHFQMKTWDEKKLDNILYRLLPSASTLHSHSKHVNGIAGPSTVDKPSAGHNLSYLLQTERNTGLTHERDPTTLRRDYKYFGKNSYWLLVEDIDGTHAPIAVKDYGRWKPKPRLRPSFKRARGAANDDDDEDTPWPLLRDDPGKAKPDWAEGKVSSDTEEEDDVTDADADGDSDLEIIHEDSQDEEMDERVVIDLGTKEDEEHDEGEAEEDVDTNNHHPLRRAASMHEIGRPTFAHPSNPKGKGVDLDNDRDYVAASGNSVVITSNINSTTSFIQHPLDAGNGRLMNKRLHQQVLTHRTLTRAAGSVLADDSVAAARPHILRKSKSTNTLKPKTARLPTREEAKKPGYCENCRVRFEDFTKHVNGKRHRKFAEDDSNFSALDEILGRLGRKTITEVEAEERAWLEDGMRQLESMDDEYMAHEDKHAHAYTAPRDEDTDMDDF